MKHILSEKQEEKKRIFEKLPRSPMLQQEKPVWTQRAGINVLTVLNLHMLTHTILSFMTVWKTSRSYALHPCGLYSGYTYSLILILPMTYSYTVRNNFIVTFKTINYSEIWVPCSDSEPEDDPMDDDEEWESYLECMKQQQNILDTLSPPWNPKPRYMYTGYIYLEYVYPAVEKCCCCASQHCELGAGPELVFYFQPACNYVTI